jgi:hypothetical protein
VTPARISETANARKTELFTGIGLHPENSTNMKSLKKNRKHWEGK